MSLLARLGFPKPAPPPLHAVPEGLLVYAIGDIHGRDDLFGELIARIDADRAARAHQQCVLILLGDLVDRGPDSDRVIERSMALAEHFDQFHCLIGNHEECMISALGGDQQALRFFVRIGGEATIRSYLRDDARYNQMGFDELAEAFAQAVPTRHIAFLERGENMVRYGDYAFVHAGVRDTLPLERQKLSDLRWIREEFTASRHDHGAVIVHGHTIFDDVDEQPNRIGIDTGAFRSGKLTAIGLCGTERWYLQTSAPSPA